jgi:BirA family biotin operon repressor/biotin-[acetyl-CoA-carboxylase] ligase
MSGGRPDMASSFLRTSVRERVIDSTNDHARRLLEAGEPPLPLLVRADRQTAGRGRGSRSWWSDEGSLTFTVALDPSAHALTAEHEPRLALTAAVAVIEAIAEVTPLAIPPGIRWPNDIEAGGRKLGGILPERVETSAGPRLLVGVGLNVATGLDESPPEVRALATSIRELSLHPRNIEILSLMDSFIDCFATALVALARDDVGLARRWERLDLLAGVPVRVQVGDRIIHGVGRGIDWRGGLRIAGEDGETTIYGGQVLRD